MRLTKEILEQGKSINGSWSAKQLKCFDVSYPFPKDWEREILGKEFPLAVIERFLSLTNAHLKDGKNVFQLKQEQELRRLDIRAMRTRGMTNPQIAALFHVSLSTISHAITRRTWNHVK